MIPRETTISDDRGIDPVSVVIPCYNAVAFLGEALESVLSQTRSTDQVIVVDDGSQDDSAKVASRYGSRICYLRQDNQGISAARNTGITHATGELIAFLDADDLWPPESLARRRAAMDEDSGLSCVFGHVEQFASTRRPVPDTGPGRLAGAMLARRSVFERVGMFDPGLRIGETLDWIARLEESGLRSRMLDAVVLRRRVHDFNTVRDRSKQADYLKALRAALQRRRGRAATS